jgi:hypothetical protein
MRNNPGLHDGIPLGFARGILLLAALVLHLWLFRCSEGGQMTTRFCVPIEATQLNTT